MTCLFQPPFPHLPKPQSAWLSPPLDENWLDRHRSTYPKRDDYYFEAGMGPSDSYSKIRETTTPASRKEDKELVFAGAESVEDVDVSLFQVSLPSESTSFQA